jgi:hypothetical protein
LFLIFKKPKKDTIIFAIQAVEIGDISNLEQLKTEKYTSLEEFEDAYEAAVECMKTRTKLL